MQSEQDLETPSEHDLETPLLLEYDKDVIDTLNQRLQNPRKYSVKYQILRNTIIILTGMAAGWMYVGPTQEMNDEMNIQGFDRYAYLIGTPGATVVVAINSAEAFFQLYENSFYFKKILPKALYQKIDPNIFVALILSALSSLPYSLVVFLYREPYANPLFLAIKFLVTELSNTLIHTLPVNIVTVFFSSLKNMTQRLIQSLYLNDAQLLELQAKEDVIAHINLIKGGMQTTLERAKLNVLQTNNAEFLQIRNFLTILQYGKIQNDAPHSSWNKFLNKIQSPIGKGAWTLGAIAGVLCIAGFDAANYQVASWFQNPFLLLLFFIPPVVLLSILCGYYCGLGIKKIPDSLFAILQNTFEWPLGFKLYPIPSTLLIGASALLAWYSPALAVKLVRDNFNDDFWKSFKPFLLLTTPHVVRLFAMTNFLLLLITYTKSYAAKWGNDEAKAQANFSFFVNDCKNAINYIKPNELLKSLNTRSVEDQKVFLNGKTIKEYAAMSTGRSRFFFCKKLKKQGHELDITSSVDSHLKIEFRR